MTDTTQSGMATQAFEMAQAVQTPTDVIRMMELGLQQVESPIPAYKIMQLTSQANQDRATDAGISGPFLRAVIADGLPYMLDGSLSKQDMAELTGKVFNRLDRITPDQDTIGEASEMLRRQGIVDRDGSIALGISRAAVLGAQVAEQHIQQPSVAAVPTPGQ